MNEFLNLEQIPKEGLLKALKEGLIALIKNKNTFFKMLTPIYVFLLYIFISCLLPGKENDYIDFILCIILFFVCAYLFIGISAVSYFAKDALENKPIRRASNYFNYVNHYFASLFKLYILKLILFLILSFSYFEVTKITNGNEIMVLMQNFVVFFFAFTSVADIFWAYQDKKHPLKSFVDAIKTFFKSSKFIIFCAVFAVFIAIGYFGLIVYLFDKFSLWLDVLKIAEIYKALYVAVFSVCVFAYYAILTYIVSFIFTRVYFEIKK